MVSFAVVAKDDSPPHNNHNNANNTSAGAAALTKNERKERYMQKTRAEASYLFKYLIITQMVVYLEAGAIPCLLDQLSVAMQMSATEQGALGGVVYLSLSAASPLCAYLLHRFNPQHVLGLSLILNNIAVLMLALTPTGYSNSANMMIFARGLIGFTQAFPCIYTPLWVDEYAPREKVAGWMSYLQGSVPMGVMMGYFIGTVSNWVVPESFQYFETWRWPFVVQFFGMCPIMIAIFFVPKKHLIIRSESDRTPTGSIDISSGNSSAVASTSDISDEHNTIEFTEESCHPAENDFLEPVPKSEGYRGADAIAEERSSELDPLKSQRSISSDVLSYMDDSIATTGTPMSRGKMRHDEEDVLLATAGMYGGGSQRGLRQLHQNQQQYHFGHSDSEMSATSSFRRIGPRSGVADSATELELGQETIHESNNTSAEVHLPYLSSASHIPRPPSSKYGALDNVITPARSPTRSLLEVSILEEEFMEEYEQGSFSEGIYELFHIPIFIFIVMGLTAVYFVVTGVQYWSTIFMIKSLHGSKYLVNALFVLVAGTGPILGVFYGGWLVDRYGGYIGVEQRAKTLGICMILGVIAFVISAATTFFVDIYITAAFLWLLLFFGGSILPACTGIFISVVPAQHRALASSFSVMIFNLLGYSLSPYITGIVMEWVLSHQGQVGSYFESCDEACAYRIGFRFCLFWSVWSFLCIGSAWWLAKRQADDARHVLEFYAVKRVSLGS